MLGDLAASDVLPPLSQRAPFLATLERVAPVLTPPDLARTWQALAQLGARPVGRFGGALLAATAAAVPDMAPSAAVSVLRALGTLQLDVTNPADAPAATDWPLGVDTAAGSQPEVSTALEEHVAGSVPHLSAELQVQLLWALAALSLTRHTLPDALVRTLLNQLQRIGDSDVSAEAVQMVRTTLHVPAIGATGNSARLLSVGDHCVALLPPTLPRVPRCYNERT